MKKLFVPIDSMSLVKITLTINKWWALIFLMVQADGSAHLWVSEDYPVIIKQFRFLLEMDLPIILQTNDGNNTGE